MYSLFQPAGPAYSPNITNPRTQPTNHPALHFPTNHFMSAGNGNQDNTLSSLVMVGRLVVVARLLGWWVGCLVGWLVACLVGLLVGCLFGGCMVGCFFGRLLALLVDWLGGLVVLFLVESSLTAEIMLSTTSRVSVR